MKLIDENDEIVLVLSDLVEDFFDAFFEFAAVFGAGDDRVDVELDDPFAKQDFRNIFGLDTLGQSFNDSGLAYARFSNQYWIVFGAAGQDLDGGLDLGGAADDWIELAILS